LYRKKKRKEIELKKIKKELKLDI
jgi:hypothetical protein